MTRAHIRHQVVFSGAQLERIAELCIEARARWESCADRDPPNYRAIAASREIGE